MRKFTITLLAAAALVISVPPAFGAVGSTNTDGYGLELTINKVKASSGQINFTVVPEGFDFKKVPYAGAANKQGVGHAHIYAKLDGAKKATYIGWTGKGLTDWTDKGMLKTGKTYRVFAVYSDSDHGEDRNVMSNWIKVTIS